MSDLTFFSFLSFSFIQGVLAFFAPCAVALLPGYVAAFATRNTEEYKEERYYKWVLTKRATKLAFFTILGLLTIYALATILIVFVNQLIKQYIFYLAFAMGIVFVLLGILMLLGKNVSLSLHLKQKKHNAESAEAYFFGIAYAIGALGCLFPLFLLVGSAAVTAPNPLHGVAYIFAYFLGMSLLMILVMFLSVFAKNWLSSKLYKILPYVTRVSGVLLILAGSYIIWYQSALL